MAGRLELDDLLGPFQPKPFYDSNKTRHDMTRTDQTHSAWQPASDEYPNDLGRVHSSPRTAGGEYVCSQEF